MNEFFEQGDNVIFVTGYVFHKSFINTYKGMDIIAIRRKTHVYYTRSMQDRIIHYLKYKGIL